MASDANRNRVAGNRDELLTCPICGIYIKKEEGFTCPRCRMRPLCKAHRVQGRRECSSCVFELKALEIADLKRQQRALKGFLSLMQFIFIVFTILFISSRTGISDSVEFLKYGFITAGLNYMGVLSVAGYLLFYVILYNQKSRIREMESSVINKPEFRRNIR